MPGRLPLPDVLDLGDNRLASVYFADLVEDLGGKVIGMGFLVELEYLKPREYLGDKYHIHSLVRLASTDED